MLKTVITRIDFDDLYEIEKHTLKELKKIAVQNNLTINTTRELSSDEDFELNDPIILRELPMEYIKSCMCYAYFNEKLDTIVEVNQFFVRFIHKIEDKKNSDYLSYVLPLLMSFINTLLSDELVVRRISIKKVYEMDFKEIKEMNYFFKPEIVQSNIFSDDVKWDIPSSGSKVVQNFEYFDKKVNFYRKIDRISIREKSQKNVIDRIYYRLYLEYEVYDRDTENEIVEITLSKKLKDINNIIGKLYKESFKEEGWHTISKGEVIEDYDNN